jgi:spore germination cell wall hydrolase CwlJ-like protein
MCVFKGSSGRGSGRANVAFLAGFLFLATTSTVAFQDITSLISGGDSATRWQSVLKASAMGSVQKAQMAFDADLTTGAISGAGFDAPGVGTVAFAAKKGAGNAVPDEERINRSQKQGRLVGVTKVAPPKAFSAGSVLQRTSSLLRPTLGGEVKMAFVKPQLQGKEISVALAFHAKQAKKERKAELPALIAELADDKSVTIAAAAYAPVEPDYARESPFDSLIKADPEKLALAIPSIKSDHPWAKNPLPKTVFSEKEQRCLATGIYFESRGESTKGQAAVAQVILNRVKNPAYPNTVCGVVYQNDHWRNRCQFSFACDGIKDRITEPFHWRKAQQVATAVSTGEIYLPEVGSSTHYYADYVSPGWARSMKKMKKIGRHIFFRTYGGGWS